MSAVHWDIFCRVIDNYGDIGVCWRLARDLASRGQAVRLLFDDRRALAWMADANAGVEVHDWPSAAPALPLADVVVEAFGCQLPEPWLQAMAAATTPPRWINLEYLSAETYVERSHGLLSPQAAGPARGLVKHFFYPGFTTATGGLLREPGLLAARARFDRDDWLARHAATRHEGERVVVLFGYTNPALPALLDMLAQAPTLLLLPRGPAQDQALAILRQRSAGALRHCALPFLSQTDFDQLLWSADLNFVRGEDSLVRALWAGAPFVWQIYPQADGVHRGKLHAFVDRLLEGVPAATGAPVRAWFDHWNGFGDGPTPALPDLAAWQRIVRGWQGRLAAQDDQTTQLIRFAAASR